MPPAVQDPLDPLVHAAQAMLHLARVHEFKWVPNKSRTGGVKAVWDGVGGHRKPLYGKAAQRVLGASPRRSKAASPDAPRGASGGIHPGGTVLTPKPEPPRITIPGSAPASTPVRGPGRRGKIRKGAAKALGVAGRVGHQILRGKIYTAAKVAQAMGWSVKTIGHGLHSLGWVERRLLFGAGQKLERAGRRQLAQARHTAALAAAGHLGAAAKRTATAAAAAAGIMFHENRQKYGFIPAALMESAYWGLKLGVAGTVVGGLAGAAAGSLPIGAIAGISAAAAVEKVMGPALSKALRKAIELPVRHGKGKRGLKAAHRILARQMDKGRMTAAPGAVTARARHTLALQPLAGILAGGTTTRSRRFAEGEDTLDPMELLAALRETIHMIDSGSGQPTTQVSDHELLLLLAHLVRWTRNQVRVAAASRVPGGAEAFAERLHRECLADTWVG